MKYYVAPLEGITGYVFRTVHHRHFKGADKYYIPFIEPKPGARKVFGGRELNDIIPEHNVDIPVVPQILTNKWEDFMWTANHLKDDYGFTELNLNLGCPSKTVANKGRGSGFLAYPQQLDIFLENIFANWDGELSIKTRIGRENPEEFPVLMEIYQKYPIKELIIHPRTTRDYYGNLPKVDAVKYALDQVDYPIGYNGDIKTIENVKWLEGELPGLDSMMMGRGILRNPQLIENILEQTQPDRKRIIEFHEDLYASYQEALSGETPVLHKMKELWCYMRDLFVNLGSYEKPLKKAKHLSEFHVAALGILQNCEIKELQMNPVDSGELDGISIFRKLV